MKAGNKKPMTRKRTTSRIIAISLLLLSLLLIFSSVSFAETEIGKVTHLSGPLFAKKADGTTRVLSINSAVEQGDTLVTEKKTYARIKFTDNSEINMRPGTQIKVSEYSFDQAKPKEDKIAMNLVKGGMRAVTGMIGKRGDQDSYKLLTEARLTNAKFAMAIADRFRMDCICSFWTELSMSRITPVHRM
jgi:hypothetical protein